jgi:hypothetical protein
MLDRSLRATDQPDRVVAWVRRFAEQRLGPGEECDCVAADTRAPICLIRYGEVAIEMRCSKDILVALHCDCGA